MFPRTSYRKKRAKDSVDSDIHQPYHVLNKTCRFSPNAFSLADNNPEYNNYFQFLIIFKKGNGSRGE